MERRRNLLKKELRRNLFYLFSGWSGKFGLPFEGGGGKGGAVSEDAAAAGGGGGGSAAAPASSAWPPITEFEFSALRVR